MASSFLTLTEDWAGYGNLPGTHWGHTEFRSYVSVMEMRIMLRLLRPMWQRRGKEVKNHWGGVEAK